MCPADKEHRKKQDEGGTPRAKDPQTDPLYEEQSWWSTPTLANLYIEMFPELESSDTHLTFFTATERFLMWQQKMGTSDIHCPFMAEWYPTVWRYSILFIHVSVGEHLSHFLCRIFSTTFLWMLMHSFCIFALIILSISLGMEVLCHTVTQSFLGKC